MSNWYVIITNPQCERKAAGELRRAGLRVYLPKRSYEYENRRGDKITKHRPLWTGYLLVRFPMAGQAPFGLARGCQGVKDFLKWLNAAGEWEPVPVPESIVLAYMRRQRSRDYDGVRAARTARELRRAAFHEGGMVRVNDGPFASFLAKVEKIRGETAHIVVELFGRETTVTVDSFVDQLEPMDTGLAIPKAAA
jgi:transcription antitermination factor NusG